MAKLQQGINMVGRLRNGDWTFGEFLFNQDEIAQNVATRIKSFKNDWFLSAEENIDWVTILSHKENRQTILDNVRRVCLDTEGVTGITTLDYSQTDTEIANRGITINLVYNDIYSQTNSLEVVV